MTLVETHASPKVYCHDCLFFLDARRNSDRRCLHAHAKYWVETSVERVQQYRTPVERNAKNDCQDFRPWRLWERILMVDPKAWLVTGLLVSVWVLALWFLLQR
jgi:hypothetical protein